MTAKDAKPPWLDEQERRAWFALASVIVRLPGVLEAQLQRDARVSHFDYLVMTRLSTVAGRSLRMSVLATLSEGSLPRLSHAVTRMERQGWVERSADPADGRFTLATLTDQGMEKLAQAAPGHVEAVRRYVFDGLSAAQVRQLATIGEHILHSLPPDETWPAAMPSDP
jgi:DNA-binding MarR family transcriptional regulator